MALGTRSSYIRTLNFMHVGFGAPLEGSWAFKFCSFFDVDVRSAIFYVFEDLSVIFTWSIDIISEFRIEISITGKKVFSETTRSIYFSPL